MKRRAVHFQHRHFHVRLCASLIVLLFGGLLPGCGGGSADKKEMGAVNGKITAEGTPVTSGLVRFTSGSAGAGAYGELQSDGSYALSGSIPVGDYKVFLSPPDFGDSPTAEQLAGVLQGVPEKYKSEATTDLTVKVEQGSNTFDFDLKE